MNNFANYMKGYTKQNAAEIISWLIAASVIFWAFGCEPKTKSLIDPRQKINLDELEFEIDTLMSKSELRLADLRKQYELRDLIFNQTLQIAQSGDINPIGVLTSALAIAGVGAGADNVRLRRKIKRDHQNIETGQVR